jgi:steroid 5-alpha reductase family enzyme
MLTDLLLTTAASIALLMLAAWLVSLPLRNASIADIVWGAGFVLVAWVTFFAVSRPLDVRQAMLVGIPTFWGLRLSLHLFRRNHGKPKTSATRPCGRTTPAALAVSVYSLCLGCRAH